MLLTIEDLIEQLKLTGEVRTLTMGDIDAFIHEEQNGPSSREWTCWGPIRKGPTTNEDTVLLCSANTEVSDNAIGSQPPAPCSSFDGSTSHEEDAKGKREQGVRLSPSVDAVLL